MSSPGETRQRLVDAGMRLFATRGFKGTTVGAIEAAVGLQPRRGALYKHFASKEALLEAAVSRHIDAVATGAEQLASLSLTGVTADELGVARGLVVEIGRWFLQELDRQADLARVLQTEGDRLGELRDLARRRIVDAGYGAAAGLARDAGGGDADAIAVVLMGSLAGLRHTTWTFGATPLGLDDERVLDAWADICIATFRAPRPTAPGRRRGPPAGR